MFIMLINYNYYCITDDLSLFGKLVLVPLIYPLILVLSVIEYLFTPTLSLHKVNEEYNCIKGQKN